MSKLYSITQAARVLNVSTRSVYEYIYQGKLRAAKIGGKWVIRVEWLDELIDSCVVQVAANGS